MVGRKLGDGGGGGIGGRKWRMGVYECSYSWPERSYERFRFTLSEKM